ncbi:sorting nexin-like protein [Skeletonema marinoi]|uniref:Sorting nexin-like protein n=1 Tax=Skeletonema marinoi TaxID=267567 RepID=A0AAD9DKX7_9STRA|nr:sorting nexin-like protein [Skeletonema marinoi]
MMESTTILGGDNAATNGNGSGTNKVSDLLSSLLIDEGDDNNTAPAAANGEGSALGNSDNLFGDSDPIVNESTDDLFGAMPDEPTMAGSALMGELLGGSQTVAAPLPAPVVSSQLSSSGLLETSTSAGLFGGADDDAGGSSGLFDDVDAEEAEKNASLLSNNGKKRQRRNDCDKSKKIVTSLKIPTAPPPAAAPPVPASSYQQYPNAQQQQQQPQQQGVMNAMAGSYYYSTTGAGQMQQGQQQTIGRPSNNVNTPPPQPSVLAGMHVGHNVHLGGVPASSDAASGRQNSFNQFPVAPSVLTNYTPPAPFDPLYGKITVNDPMLIQGSGLFSGPPHWTYLVTVYGKNDTSNQPISAVRRRFRHFVALEDRIRTSVPGAILPPRPDKHPARAIEEASASQSADFAQQRAQELSFYLNALLKLFLTLQDHIGTAWPEVSSSAFTRLTAVGAAAVEKMSESVDGVLQELGTAQQVAAGEDSADILALAAYEGRRIGAMSKLSKDVAWCDRELSMPMDVLSSALLRCGRRTKRLGLELGAAISPFVIQYALLKRRTEARSKADGRAAKLMMNQSSMAYPGTLDRMETEAAMYDEMATEVAKEADDVALRLQNEVGRIGALRVKQWDSSMKVIASGFKEACAENAAIWESALEAFKREFPDVNIPEASAQEGGVPSWHRRHRLLSATPRDDGPIVRF